MPIPDGDWGFTYDAEGGVVPQEPPWSRTGFVNGTPIESVAADRYRIICDSADDQVINLADPQYCVTFAGSLRVNAAPTPTYGGINYIAMTGWISAGNNKVMTALFGLDGVYVGEGGGLVKAADVDFSDFHEVFILNGATQDLWVDGVSRYSSAHVDAGSNLPWSYFGAAGTGLDVEFEWVAIADTPIAPPAPSSYPVDIHIGSTLEFDIDEFALYAEQLTAEQRARHYAAGRGVPL